MERHNPLPPNARYWVDTSPADQPAFNAWLSMNRGAVKVVSTTRDPKSGWEWVLFEVTAPLVWWDGPGYPTIADADVVRESDVKQIPHVQSASEILDELGESVSEVAGGATTKIAIGAIAILVGVVLLNRVMR